MLARYESAFLDSATKTVDSRRRPVIIIEGEGFPKNWIPNFQQVIFPSKDLPFCSSRKLEKPVSLCGPCSGGVARFSYAVEYLPAKLVLAALRARFFGKPDFGPIDVLE